MPRKALIIGANGVVGANLAKQLISNGWEGTGTARKKRGTENPAVQMIFIDLLDKQKAREAFENRSLVIRGVTHLFFCAYLKGKTSQEEVETNTTLLRNSVDVISEICEETLRHVYLQTGTKWYGVQYGPSKGYKIPSRESDPRINIEPNFYYTMHDYLVQKQQGKNWTWSEGRPDVVIGFSTQSAMNLGVSLAVYATLMKALNKPLIFPGGEEAYHSLKTFSDVNLLCEAIEWMATNEQCKNQAFNINNGDAVRWDQIWPVVANFFGLKVEISPKPLKMRELIGNQTELWSELQKKHQLLPHSLDELMTYDFADFYLQLMKWDNLTDTSKAKQFGFTRSIRTDEMFTNFFQKLQQLSVIPKF